MTAAWVALFLGAITGALFCGGILPSKLTIPDSERLFFGCLVAVFSVIAYLGFLRIVAYGAREW